jgi:hypothetical protein
MSRLDIDMTEFKEFFGKMEQFAKGQFKEELIEYVDTIGFDFLRVVQDEIVRRKVIDTRLLLASFEALKKAVQATFGRLPTED